MDDLNLAREHFLAAFQFHTQGRLQEAEPLYREALALAPGRPSVINNLAALLFQLGRIEESRILCEQLLDADNRNAPAHLNLGNCHLANRATVAALECFDRALAIDPGYVEALASRGKALTMAGQPSDALASCDRALAIKPDHVDALTNRGGALMELRNYQDALFCYDRICDITPNNAKAHVNRANALRDTGRYQDALEAYARSAALDPNLVYAHWNECLCRLLMGDFKRGWEKHDWRWKTDHGLPSARTLPLPLWDGSRLDGTLFVWGEQGLGEQILYGGLLDELRPLATRLLVELEPRLIPLFRRAFPDIEFITADGSAGVPMTDAHVPLGDLPKYFRTRWEDFPSRPAGYLKADSHRANELRRQLAGAQRPVVGLSWSSITNRPSERKTMRLIDFEPALRLPGARFIDLQYGDTAGERSAVEHALGVRVERLAEIDNRLDLDGLAALITSCDAVVTISNTTAHLAGALGVPTFLVLPWSLPSHWYWHIDRNPNPWYPSIEVIRQPSIDDWQGAVRRACERLRLQLGPGEA